MPAHVQGSACAFILIQSRYAFLCSKRLSPQAAMMALLVLFVLPGKFRGQPRHAKERLQVSPYLADHHWSSGSAPRSAEAHGTPLTLISTPLKRSNQRRPLSDLLSDDWMSAYQGHNNLAATAPRTTPEYFLHKTARDIRLPHTFVCSGS